MKGGNKSTLTMQQLFRFTLLTFASSLVCMAGWKIRIDKETSQITGSRNARAAVEAKGSSRAFLMLGCNDATPMLRIVEDFSMTNAITDALIKSPLERAVNNRGQQHETKGFVLGERDGHYYSRVKLRLSASTEYLDTEVVAGYVRGVYYLALDDRRADMLPKLKADTMLYAQLPYKGGDRVVEFDLKGLTEALAKLASVGCNP